MNTRYLEIDSTFRNRSRWPLPAQFEVEVSQSGTKNRITAVDPISTQAPTTSFNGSFDNSVASANIAITSLLPTTTTMDGINGPNALVIGTAAGDLRTEKDFYVGAILRLTNIAPLPPANIRIASYDFQDAGDTAYITTFDTIPGALLATAGTVGTIINPTDATNTIQPGVFIPSGSNRDNRYINYCLENVTRSQIRTITSYNPITHIAYFANNPAAGWQPDDDYILRRNCPNINGTLAAVASESVMTLAVGSSQVDNFYVGELVDPYQ